MILLRDYGLPCRYLLLDGMGDHAEVEFSKNFGSSACCSGHTIWSLRFACVYLTDFLMNSSTQLHFFFSKQKHNHVDYLEPLVTRMKHKVNNLKYYIS